MKHIETMKLALEALERCVATCFDQYAHHQVMSRPEHFVNQTITALRQAIEQAQQQERALDCTRVACMGNGGCVGSCWNNDTSQERVDETAKQRHEPCGLECDCTDVCKQLVQRQWVGLTDEEIYSVLENLQVMHHRPPTTDSRVIFAHAIEAKLKEKNT